jgi:hypothetical protein
VLRPQADLLAELAEHRVLRGLAVLDAALRKLPGVLVHPLAPEHLIAQVCDDDAYIGPVTVPVEHGNST